MRIRPYRPADRAALVETLVRIRSESSYPWVPDASPATVAEWLERGETLARFIAADTDDRSVGHVQLVDLAQDRSGLTQWLADVALFDLGSLWEVARLFVDPAELGRGVGGALLDHAAAVSHAAGRVPVLWVLDTQVAAIRLYRCRGWRHLGDCVDHPAGRLLVFAGPSD